MTSRFGVLQVTPTFQTYLINLIKIIAWQVDPSHPLYTEAEGGHPTSLFHILLHSFQFYFVILYSTTEAADGHSSPRTLRIKQIPINVPIDEFSFLFLIPRHVRHF